MKEFIVRFFLVSFAIALFATSARAGDSKVKGLWLEIPGLPEASSTSFNVQSGGEGEAYFERNFDGGIVKISIERVYSEDRNGDALVPGDTGKLTVKLESLRENMEIALEDIEITESVENLEEIYSYPVATAVYATGEGEYMRENQDIFIFTDEWIFRIHLSFMPDCLEDYDGDEMRGWIENMRMVDR